MATRRPLVLINGKVAELPSGDLVAGAGSGSGVVGEGLSFGADTPFRKYQFTFNYALPGVTTTSVIVASLGVSPGDYEVSGDFMAGWTLVTEVKADLIVFYVFSPTYIDQSFQINYIKV